MSTQFLTDDEWRDKFKPAQNQLDDDASCDGELFETYGPEEQYIRDICAGKVPGLSELNVWTFMDAAPMEPGDLAGQHMMGLGYTYSGESGDWLHGDEPLPLDYTCDGFHTVNRTGHFITEVARDPDTNYLIYLSEELRDAKRVEFEALSSMSFG